MGNLRQRPVRHVGETARRRPVRLNEHRLGEEALHFTRWFAHSKYHLMGGFAMELTRAGDPTRLRERFSQTLQHAQRVHQARAVVTLLLALGVVAAAASAIANLLRVAAPTGILERAAALSASLSVLLIALRIGFDRYLERCDVAATFLAIQLSAASSSAPGGRATSSGLP